MKLSEDLTLTMLPVSAGDSTLLRWHEGQTAYAVLIDTGLKRDECLSYLQKIGVFHLDLVVISHPDMDHIGGLTALMHSKQMSIDRIWSFDLNFLRTYIRTGVIPKPKSGTRDFVYYRALMSTLDRFDDALSSATLKGVELRQVAEGHQFALGGVLFDVLYPTSSFYRNLRHPGTLKKLLRRKIPSHWENFEREIVPASAIHETDDQRRRPILMDDEMGQDELGGVHLVDHHDSNWREDDSKVNRSEETIAELDVIPLRLVGTLYNNLSLVFRVSRLGGINPTSILFTGDLSDWTQLIYRQGPNLQSNILKMPHHGSKRVSFNIRWFEKWLDEELLLRKRYLLGRFSSALWSRAHERWIERLYHLTRNGKYTPIEAIQYLVNSEFVLIFPNPQHRLPSVEEEALSGTILSNREYSVFSDLRSKKTPIRPNSLLIGAESSDLRNTR